MNTRRGFLASLAALLGLGEAGAGVKGGPDEARDLARLARFYGPAALHMDARQRAAALRAIPLTR